MAKAPVKKSTKKTVKKTVRKESRDIQQEITDKIIEALENGVKPWVCPWDKTISESAMPVNFSTGNAYRGANIMLLWIDAQLKGYESNQWLTFKQAKDLGGNVRKGEKGSTVIKYKVVEKEDKETGETDVYPMLKGFTVFNAEQIEGIEFPKPVIEDKPEFERLESADQFIAHSGASILHQGVKAFFTPLGDQIVMPEPQRFKTQSDYYATLLHELTHWTGHASRLNRKFGTTKGNKDYAFEELVAELGAAFLCAELGIKGEVQHESYIANWLQKLRNDKRFIFKAASQASKAFEYLVDCNKPNTTSKAA